MKDADGLYLTLVDTSGIQDYVFSSNALAHQVGASGLVHACTNDWIFEILEKSKYKSNIKHGEIVPDLQIVKDKLGAELVYTGGGNALLLFKDLLTARAFAHDLSMKAAREADGLQVVITHQPFDPSQSFAEAMEGLLQRMFQKKRGRPASAPLLGLGVTAACQYSGLPAVSIDDHERFISRQILQKQSYFQKADGRLKSLIHNRRGFEFLYQLNDLGEEGNRYMAVIHTDGNGMSDRNRKLLARYGGNYREYIQKMRAFAQSVKKASETALNAVFDYLANAESVGLVKTVDKHLPFRPIVFGGDDNTFVCTGDLGLRLASLFIKELAEIKLDDGEPISAKELAEIKLDDGEPISARAGVAIVKTHYPFSRAYKLAEDLSKSAKDLISSDKNNIFSAIDWHIANTGPIIDLKGIRANEYISDDDHSLCMRPVHINSPRASWQSWENVENMLHAFNRDFGRGNNQLKEMREYLRYGEEASKMFIDNLKDAHLPEIPGLHSAQKDGWQEHICCYFDAIELLDYYRDLEVHG